MVRCVGKDKFVNKVHGTGLDGNRKVVGLGLGSVFMTKRTVEYSD